MILLSYIPDVCLWISTHPEVVFWDGRFLAHKGENLMRRIEQLRDDTIIFDDEIIYHLPRNHNFLSLTSIQRAHKCISSVQWMPTPGMARREYALLGADFLPFLEARFKKRALILFQDLQQKILPLSQHLCDLTGCSLSHALRGLHIKMFNCYVYRNKALRTLLQQTEPAEGMRLRGGEIFNVNPGIVHLAPNERVSVLDFSSAYPSIGSKILRDDLLPIGEAFQHLLQLRQQEKNPTAAKAIKLFTNAVFYGCLASTQFTKFSHVEAAGRITASCREMLREARETALSFEGVEVLAGHTDSVIVKHRVDLFPRILGAIMLKTCAPFGVVIKRDQEFLPPRFLVQNRTCYAGLTTEGIVFKGLGSSTPEMVHDIVRDVFLKSILLGGEPREANLKAKEALRKELQWGCSVSRMAHLYAGKENHNTPEGRLKHRFQRVIHPIWMSVHEGQVAELREHSCSWWNAVLVPDVAWMRKKKLEAYTLPVLSILAPASLSRSPLTVGLVSKLGLEKIIEQAETSSDAAALLRTLLQISKGKRQRVH